MELDERIGIELKRQRDKLKLSTREVGRRIGISYSYVSRIENGRIPSLATLQKMCDLYEIDIKSLFGEEVEPTKEMQDLGMEWITFSKEMEKEELTPEEIKKYINVVKSLKSLS